MTHDAKVQDLLDAGMNVPGAQTPEAIYRAMLSAHTK